MPAKPKKLYRTDHFEHGLNKGKEKEAWQFLYKWRQSAKPVAAEQWRLFYETGRLDKFYSDKALSQKAGGVNICHDIRRQVVGMLESLVSNRANDFERTVARSSLSESSKEKLYMINRRKAWFGRPSLSLTPEELATLKLARQIMHHILKRHRRPRFNHINATLGKNLAEIQESKTLLSKNNSEDGTKTDICFPLWLNISTLTKGQRVLVPLKNNRRYAKRKGDRLPAVQIIQKGHKLVFGLITDVAPTYKLSADNYQPKTEELALDFGLRTLFATDQGDLLGRDFLARLSRYDARITDLARYRRRHGQKVRCTRYDKYVGQLRGFLKNEINRVLNKLVATHQPKCLVLERLNFQSPNLSRRLNRILQNCGRSIVRAKLKDLEEKYGLGYLEVNPAYSSQICNNINCGYIDAQNRNGEKFVCRFCSKRLHADVAGARIIKSRRSWPEGAIYTSKKTILHAQVALFMERHEEAQATSTGPKSESSDPRASNPYFKEYQANFKGKTAFDDVKHNQKITGCLLLFSYAPTPLLWAFREPLSTLLL